MLYTSILCNDCVAHSSYSFISGCCLKPSIAPDELQTQCTWVNIASQCQHPPSIGITEGWNRWLALGAVRDIVMERYNLSTPRTPTPDRSTRTLFSTRWLLEWLFSWSKNILGRFRFDCSDANLAYHNSARRGVDRCGTS